MGDLVSPKRRDVFDRLRRRIEQYRRHHGATSGRYEPGVNGLFADQSRQDTLLLHQRWREARAKRAASKSKAKDQGGSGEPRSQAAGSKKRKSESQPAPADPTNIPEPPFHFDDPGSPSAKIPRSGANQSDAHDAQNKVHSSVNIDIVQQINNNQSDPSQLPQIKLTVSQTLQTGVGAQPPTSGGLAHATTSVTTNFCKKEVEDDTNAHLDQFIAELGTLDFEGDVIDVIGLLSKIEKDPGPIDFGDDSISSGSLTDDKEAIPDKTKGSMYGSGTSTKGSPSPAMYADPVYDYEGSVNQNIANMGCPGAAAIANYPRPPAGGAAPQPPILNVGDTGPAAETLKQMAAQHQSQESAQYGMKGPVPPYGPEYADNYNRRMPSTGAYAGYPGQYPGMQGAGPNNMYPQYAHPPNHMNNMPRERAPIPGQVLPPGAKPGNHNLNYRGTKPLTHYDPATVGSQSSPSSLEQLQNQVQSHFSQTQGGQGQPGQGQSPGHMQITQSQHMQMTHGNHRMHVSQTQHMQIHGNGVQPISVAQQQSFNMAQSGMTPQQQNQYMQQMYQEKLRRQEMEQRQMAYMNRPPPEYKVPPGGMPANPTYPANSAGHGTMGTNPLQTMQNMVNQTAGQGGSTPNGMYNVPMKTEIPSGQSTIGNQGMASIPPNASRGSPMSASPNPVQTGTDIAGYPPNSRQQQMITGQPMPNHTGGNGSGPSRPMKPGTPVYTSTLMRNQRPPNVNVGPDGLNISQQRPHSAEWSRQMMASGQGGGQQPQQMGQMVRSPMPNAAMMAQYGGYGSQTAMSMAGPSGPRMAMSQQQAALQQQGMHSNGASMMMQQQQQVHMANSHTMPNMTMSQSMSTSTASQQASNQGQAHPGQGHPGQGHPGQSHPGQSHPGQGHPGHPGQSQGHAGQNQGHPGQSHPGQGHPVQGQGHPSQGHPGQGQTHPGQSQGHPGQGQSHPGQGQGPQGNFPQGGASSNSDFPLDFLDNPQTTNSDFFDSMVPTGNSGDLFDDLMMFGK